jgi:hypothetical protein
MTKSRPKILPSLKKEHIMSYVDSEMIQKAGQHLLSIMRDAPTIRYSEHF